MASKKRRAYVPSSLSQSSPPTVYRRPSPPLRSSPPTPISRIPIVLSTPRGAVRIIRQSAGSCYLSASVGGIYETLGAEIIVDGVTFRDGQNQYVRIINDYVVCSSGRLAVEKRS